MFTAAAWTWLSGPGLLSPWLILQCPNLVAVFFSGCWGGSSLCHFHITFETLGVPGFQSFGPQSASRKGGWAWREGRGSCSLGEPAGDVPAWVLFQRLPLWTRSYLPKAHSAWAPQYSNLRRVWGPNKRTPDSERGGVSRDILDLNHNGVVVWLWTKSSQHQSNKRSACQLFTARIRPGVRLLLAGRHPPALTVLEPFCSSLWSQCLGVSALFLIRLCSELPATFPSTPALQWGEPCLVFLCEESGWTSDICPFPMAC